jgi:hypothetical protein
VSYDKRERVPSLGLWALNPWAWAAEATAAWMVVSLSALGGAAPRT